MASIGVRHQLLEDMQKGAYAVAGVALTCKSRPERDGRTARAFSKGTRAAARLQFLALSRELHQFVIHLDDLVDDLCVRHASADAESRARRPPAGRSSPPPRSPPVPRAGSGAGIRPRTCCGYRRAIFRDPCLPHRSRSARSGSFTSAPTLRTWPSRSPAAFCGSGSSQLGADAGECGRLASMPTSAAGNRVPVRTLAPSRVARETPTNSGACSGVPVPAGRAAVVRQPRRSGRR